MEEFENAMRDHLNGLKKDWHESIEYSYRAREPYVTEMDFNLEKIDSAFICYKIVEYLRHGMPGKGNTLFIPKSGNTIGAQLRKESNKLTKAELDHAAYLGSVIKQQEMKMILAYGLIE